MTNGQGAAGDGWTGSAEDIVRSYASCVHIRLVSRDPGGRWLCPRDRGDITPQIMLMFTKLYRRIRVPCAIAKVLGLGRALATTVSVEGACQYVLTQMLDAATRWERVKESSLRDNIGKRSERSAEQPGDRARRFAWSTRPI